MVLKGTVHFRFDNPALFCAAEYIRTWFYDVEHVEQNINLYDEEHDVQSHLLRPTITDMQDKYSGDCYDIYFIQSQYTKVARPAAAPPLLWFPLYWL